MACLTARNGVDPTAARAILLSRGPAFARLRLAARPLCGLAAALLALAACRAPAPLAPPPPLPARTAGAVLVRLAFGAEADLDLYATDPAEETVYFANPVSAASGGALEADLRCDAPVPRVETVRFAPAPPGHYRVGVDFPSRCGSHRGPVPFVLVAEFGDQRLERRGEVALGQFLPVVLEFEHRH